MIRKEKGKWFLYSKDGSKKLGGPFDSKKEAEDRERQVKFFKHRKADVIDGLVEIDLIITKANIGPDGEPRWLAVASDTIQDKTGERTSLGLFQDWTERIEKNLGVHFLPPPRKPFLGVSHYSDLDGFGEAGITDKMYVDGTKFKAGGQFFTDDQHPLGPVLFQAVSNEREFIRRGGDVEQPIRISAAWWDLQHAHGDFVFTRQSLSHKCPMCQQGNGTKVYLKGQLDHFATTRVPINPRTSLQLEEKSMATTRKEDAATIVGEDLAEELEKRSRLVGKSETEAEDQEGLVIKADEEDEALTEKASKIGSFLRKRREEMDMSIADLAAKMPITESTIGNIESGDIMTPSKPVLAAFAKALKVKEGTLRGMLGKDAEPADKIAKNKSETDVEESDVTPDPDGEATVSAEESAEESVPEPVAEKAHGKKKDKAKKEMASDDDDRMDDRDEDEEDDEDEREEKEEKADLATVLSELDPVAVLTALSEAGLIERMPDENPAPAIRLPLGGATSIAEAEAVMAAKDKANQVHDNFGLFMTVMGNIMSMPDEGAQDKINLISQAISDFGDRIDALKSGLADAYLLQPAAIEIEEPEVEISKSEAKPIMTEQLETTVQEDQPQDVYGVLKAAIDTAKANNSLNRAQKAEAIQAALGEFVQVLRSDLDRSNPQDVADVVSKALEPIAEKMALIEAKLNAPAQPDQPQQKSLATVKGSMVTGPSATDMAAGMSIRDIARRSVGLQ